MRLFWQVYLASLAFVLFSMALLTSVVSYRDSQYSLSALRSEQRLIAVTAASQVAAGYHENSWPFGMLWAISREPQFAFWEIVDSEGKSVLSDGSLGATFAGSNVHLAKPRWSVATGTSTVDLEQWVVPLPLGGSSNPWLFRLGFRTTAVRLHVWDTIRTNVLVALAIALLLIFVSFAFTHRLLRPLRSLALAAAELERGNLDLTLPPAKADEFGQLMRAFGSMVASIRQRDDAIRSHVETLRSTHDDLEIREARLRAVIDHAVDGIISANERGVVEVFNPSAERIFGYGPEELIGGQLDPLLAEGYSIDAEGGIVESQGKKSIRLGRAAEIYARRKDGTIFPLQIALSEVYVGQARRMRTAIVRDISERKRAEAERKEMDVRLLQASRQAGMVEVATSVLHNVGNVLNSVNVSATVLAEGLRGSKVEGLARASALMKTHAADLGSFVTADPAGKLLPAYLTELARVLEAERAAAMKELSSLLSNIEHIKAVVTQQQTYARVAADVVEDVALAGLCDDALRILGADLAAYGIEIVRTYAPLPVVRADRNKLLQIVVNLVSNAKHALAANDAMAPRLLIETARDEGEMQRIRIVDNGIGIAPENLLKIFNYGFTTKKGGHGFGLHSSALAAGQMGGGLSAESAGTGRGAVFVLRIPSRPHEESRAPENRYEHAS
jgi:PAS domain S-box-containing protein